MTVDHTITMARVAPFAEDAEHMVRPTAISLVIGPIDFPKGG